MASDYGRNFGFRRSDENSRIAEGRYKTPTGTPLQIGTAVVIDPANPGYLKAGAANEPLVTGWSGLLLQEEIFIRSIYETMIVDSYTLGIARVNRLSVLTSGPGTKFWLRNTISETRADGRVIPAVTMVNLTGISVGDSIGWTGTQWAKTTTAAYQWATVTTIDATAYGMSAGSLEAVLTR